MEDFRIRPKDRYIQDADWRNLYVLTECWKSNMLFFKEDLKFLDFLIENYFDCLSIDENNEEVLEVRNSLATIKKLCNSLLFKVNKHLACIENLIYNPHKYDTSEFRKEHQLLEDKLIYFLKVFRENRKEIFALINQLPKSKESTPQITLSNSAI